ncbi:hypothetical protein [Paenibacillus sp. FSL R7-0026]|uniref:hypothetical protein n=1 Tax=Paenibacillus sp. FSL R7-0026 TaxID=2921668 RepID=UPI0030FCCAE6
MKYPVIQTFRETPKFNRYVKGKVFETEDKERAEYLQKEGFLGPEIKEEKPKTSRGKANTGKGKSDDPGGDVNESSKAEPKDTPAKEE